MQLEASALRQLQQFYIQEEPEQEQDFSSVQVMLYSSRKFGPESIRHLQSDSGSQLVMMPGIITSSSRPKASGTTILLFVNIADRENNIIRSISSYT